MNSPVRVNEDLFDFDNDVRIYEGKPFTGIGFGDYFDSRLKRELPYRDGFPEGLCNEWHPNGQLQREWFAVRGRAVGKVKSWYENGKIQSIGEYEYGVEMRYEEWDITGTKTIDREIRTGCKPYEYVQIMRQRESRRE
jgi:antitoxin component YwqK of YwqJK toxin-antitoxin module